MNGLMMQQPLLISTLLTHAERHHGTQQVVSRRVEGDVHRYTYRELGARARSMANALSAQGIRFGDHIGLERLPAPPGMSPLLIRTATCRSPTAART